jgi:hypothetical protein
VFLSVVDRSLLTSQTFCFIWIVAGVLATAITLPIKANAGRRSAAEVFT